MSRLRTRGRTLQKLRRRIWARDPHCAMCREIVAFPGGFELDHRMPLFKGGTNDDSNLQVLCIACHARKTEADMGCRPRARFDERGRVIWDRG